MTYLRWIASIGPSLFLGWVNAWMKLFTATLFAPPNSDGSPDVAAASSATVIVVLICFACRRWDDARLRKYAYSSSFLALVCLGAILALRFYLKYPRPREVVETLYEVWTDFYIVALNLIVVAVLFAVMSYRARPPRAIRTKN